MQTTDPFTSFVAACVMPAAAATCMVWSFYLLASGTTPSWLGARRQLPRRRISCRSGCRRPRGRHWCPHPRELMV